MSHEKRREVARKGGMSLNPENRTFSRDRALAVSAGAKGGISVAPEDRAFSRDPALAKRAGRKGGQTASKP